jgi:WhiB family redox-sensing transcriptional regulator
MPGTLDWRGLASCRDYDPELWFPVGFTWTREQEGRAENAKMICRRCPVRERCLAEALAEGDEFSIRGATTPNERRAITARQRATGSRAIA